MQINLPKVDKIATKIKGDLKPLILAITKNVIEKERRLALENFSYKSEDEILNEVQNEYERAINLELKPLINATGVVLHTNLGRSVIHPEILKRASKVISSYSNLEYDLEAGKRGARHDYTALLCKVLFGCGDALVVNNNAAAVLLTLNTFAKNSEVIVSRGELVEIGGSFRIPEVMESSGAILKEVGTTNKTKLKDYEEAVDENTKMLMKVHRSNFTMQGFCESVEMSEIHALAKEKNLVSYYDLGSAFVNELPYALSKDEPPLKKVLENGASLVSFSGDKLLGSVQCGIIIGDKNLIAKLKQNQLLRALRVDKLTLSILNETLKAYINKEYELITAIAQIYKKTDELEKMANLLKSRINFECKVVKTTTFVGGGTLPNRSYPSVSLSFSGDAVVLETLFRQKGVIGRIENGEFMLDFRSILDKDLESLAQICNGVFNE